MVGRNSDPWFRFYVRTLNNPKAQRLPGGTFKGWVNLLCLAKETDGTLPPVEDVSFRLRLSKAKTESLLNTLRSNGLIDGDRMHDWDHMQYPSDSSTERVKRHRERAKEPTRNVSSNVSGTAQTREDKKQTQKQSQSRERGTNGKTVPYLIFAHWNTFDNLTNHRALNRNTATVINARTKAGYSEADLCRAITRYAEMKQEGVAPGFNDWGLFELMSRNQGGWIDKMLDPNYKGIVNDNTDSRRSKRNAEVLGINSKIPRIRS